ncbi:hypothetical protein DWB84_06740 [Saccharophagus sp. K07]|jgi:hypothetical protein|uniref:hypothetical protein n=1 Tax=Saccharophagus sp. K07 TaxID=2283636 RepID=UPI0016524D04|nr:hypothetical protein [Saccharophagus sp. K07]MBC6905158.1 hypothetical protein [Saccharophagus sp. K07]
MNLFRKSKQTKSIADFKSGAQHISEGDAINAITGGIMNGCHPITKNSLLSSLAINPASLNASLGTVAVRF